MGGLGGQMGQMDSLTEKLIRVAREHKRLLVEDLDYVGPYLDWLDGVLREAHSTTWKPPISDTFTLGQQVTAGLLRDVSETGRLVGFQELYITADVWATVNNLAPQSKKTVRERLLEVIIGARRAFLFGEEKFKVRMLHGKRHFAQFRLEGNVVHLRGRFSLRGGTPLPD